MNKALPQPERPQWTELTPDEYETACHSTLEALTAYNHELLHYAHRPSLEQANLLLSSMDALCNAQASFAYQLFTHREDDSPTNLARCTYDAFSSLLDQRQSFIEMHTQSLFRIPDYIDGIFKNSINDLLRAENEPQADAFITVNQALRNMNAPLFSAERGACKHFKYSKEVQASQGLVLVIGESSVNSWQR